LHRGAGAKGDGLAGAVKAKIKPSDAIVFRLLALALNKFFKVS
jgi:hypothetical protein